MLRPMKTSATTISLSPSPTRDASATLWSHRNGLAREDEGGEGEDRAEVVEAQRVFEDSLNGSRLALPAP